MKAKTLLVAAVMFFAFTAAAFAQATFQVGSIPVTAVTATGQTEKTGSITFTTTGGIATAVGTITISYGVPITNTPVSGDITGTAILGTLPTIGSVNNLSGVVVLNVTAGFTGNFTLGAVRVAVAGTTLTSLTANISAVGNAIVAGQTSVTVISSIANALASATSTAGAINGTNGAVTTQPLLLVKENYLDAFGKALTTGGQTQGIEVRFTLSAFPPAGVKITFPGAGAYTTSATGDNPPATGVTWHTSNADGDDLGTDVVIASDSTSLSVYYLLTTDSDSTKIETLRVPLTIDTSKATLPLASSSITVTATMAPIGTAFGSNNAVITDQIPRFAALEVGPATLYQVSGSTTTMIIPFASTVSATGYNTGIAVSNTSTDPGKTAMGGFKTAIKQAGTMTFYFYPAQSGSTAGIPFSYTTSASSPGSGLDSTGKVPSGSTYTVLLSQLLAAAQAPADFSGYIFIVTGFTTGHCQYIITDFKAFANGGQALIVDANRDVSVEALKH